MQQLIRAASISHSNSKPVLHITVPSRPTHTRVPEPYQLTIPRIRPLEPKPKLPTCKRQTLVLSTPRKCIVNISITKNLIISRALAKSVNIAGWDFGVILSMIFGFLFLFFLGLWGWEFGGVGVGAKHGLGRRGMWRGDCALVN
ncbi:zinc finger (C3HC4-type RING finger) family protein [Striga asiatica]|uniref:Zinc finger (C3HC4-type RING finger) family protein n=1 Tax=Striga asiatica TaxID=4170 RepID=A0A5A7Q3M0_STRAF|nr:zinc finger (C3HC4-type RING finger) family protein [Striga asiatica]